MSGRLRVVFDLDGTLVDSVGSLAAAVNALLREMGREALAVEQVKGFVGHGARRLVERSLAATGGVPGNDVGPWVARFLCIYEADPVTGVVAYPGAEDALRALAADGHGLAVCTQKPEAAARQILRAFGMMPPVDGLTGGDSLPVLKPDARLLHHAAAQVGEGPVVFVGDSEVDAETALNAGVPFVLHLGGYRHGALEEIRRAGAFERFTDLRALLDEVRRGAA